MMMTQIYFATT